MSVLGKLLGVDWREPRPAPLRVPIVEKRCAHGLDDVRQDIYGTYCANCGARP